MSSETLDTVRARGAGGRARTITLAAVLVNALDGSIVHTALPTIQSETGATSAAVRWIPAAYPLDFTPGLITGGRLGGLYGRKRAFLLPRRLPRS